MAPAGVASARVEQVEGRLRPALARRSSASPVRASVRGPRPVSADIDSAWWSSASACSQRPAATSTRP